MHSAGDWILQLGIGTSFGLLLFLLASGFTLTFGLARFVNLAHGAVFLVSAYVATSVSAAGWPFPVVVLAATVCGLLLSLLAFGLARLRWRRIEADVLAQVLLTFGVLLVFADVARSHWGGVPRSVPTPGALDGAVPLGDAALPVYRLFVIGAALAVAAGLWLLQDRTIFGALVRAGVDDRQMLAATGVRAAPLFVAVFALAGALAGLAAGLGTPVLGATMGQEYEVLVLALVIVVLGGAGSLRGAFIASVAVGLVDAFGKAFIPSFAGFSMMALVVVVLAWRPDGLLAPVSR